ncbi:response regulator transcription factor [Motilimonas pumila]|uniref:DNA-binding response regulator n=1 Tax=Motilimonas pumila TaxID=2303987 RepID=A0A418YBB3_9GAMM|nr:response regulator transcription factor [Motilimonas pumila]RJG40285.1 DNA-binding response regulator [Motilimonas pumila]
MKLLLVEDHHDIAGVLFDYFELKGYTLEHAINGELGFKLAQQQHYDLIILDISLPGVSGLQVCKQLREDGNDTPILMLTARETRDDTLAGFKVGADDYLIKPFDLDILDARIDAILRRRKPTTKAWQFSELSLMQAERMAVRQQQKIPLNPTAFTILKLLMTHAPDVVTREQMIDTLWPDDVPEGDLLRSHIYQLRCVIDRPFRHEMIKTVPKIGFKLQAVPTENTES